MTIQQIIERLQALERALSNGVDISYSLAMLRLDIEIHCTRTGVPIV